MSIKVSIIIPVYNEEKYIIRCLSSVISQTYLNLECIIIDDSSQDNSVTIIQSFLKEYKGPISFYFIQNDINKGLSFARNIGTLHATGDYIFYLDADDAITTNCISKLVNEADNFHDVDIVQGNTIRIPNDHSKYQDLRSYNFPSHFTNNEMIRSYFYDPWKSFPIPVWNKLIRTGFIRDNKLYFLEGVIHEDVDWIYQAIKYMQSIVFVMDYTYIHYIVPNSIMTSTNDEKSGRNMGIILRHAGFLIDDADFERQYIKYLYQLSIWFLKVPQIAELREANKLFALKAKEHLWFSIFIILTMTRLISRNRIGNRLGASLAHRWINFQRQKRKWS